MDRTSLSTFSRISPGEELTTPKTRKMAFCKRNSFINFNVETMKKRKVGGW